MIVSEARGVGGSKLNAVAERARRLPLGRQSAREVDWSELSLPKQIRTVFWDREVHNATAWNAFSTTVGRFEVTSHFMLLIALSGSGVVGVGDKVFALNEGEACLVAPGETHYYLRLPRDFEWLRVAFVLDSAGAEFLSPLTDHARVVSRKVRRLLNQFLQSFMESSTPRDALDVSLTLREILVELHDAGPGEQGGLELSLTEKARAHVITHREGKTGLEALASNLATTPAKLKSIFQHEVGVSFGSFVRSVRLLHAAHILTETEKSVEEVSRRCGFKSVDSFRGVFTDFHRVTPEEYRARHA